MQMRDHHVINPAQPRKLGCDLVNAFGIAPARLPVSTSTDFPAGVTISGAAAFRNRSSRYPGSAPWAQTPRHSGRRRGGETGQKETERRIG